MRCRRNSMTDPTGAAGGAAGLPDFLRAMLSPDFYPRTPSAVELVQTHISYVLLAGDEVFKVKKPVRFSFLDFSTLERRRHFCAEELRLNRRLSTGIYLEVVAICGGEGGFHLGREDDPLAVEYAVRMRRLAGERMFSRMVQHGIADSSHVEVIARRLADFHAGAEAGPDVAAFGAPEALIERMHRDFREADSYRGRTVSAADDDAIRGFCIEFVTRHAPRVRARQDAGRIREGHGDLRAEHVCFAGELQIIDCIEFDRGLRCRDVAAEVAFLAMDIEFLGRSDLARHLVAAYAAAAGDAELAWLVPFYQCYYAYIRGKVESLTSAEPEVAAAQRRDAAAAAARHFAMAYRYSWVYSPILVVVCGLSGSGKTTVAAALAERLGFLHVNSDVVRKQLGGLPTDRPSPAAAREVLYSAEQSRRTYAAMEERARGELHGGRGVIVDATFQRREHRRPMVLLAEQAAVPLLFVECRCDDDEIRRRLDRRVRSGRGASDADWRVYESQRERYEEFAGAEAEMCLAVAAADPLAAVVARIERAARQRIAARSAR